MYMIKIMDIKYITVFLILYIVHHIQNLTALITDPH